MKLASLFSLFAAAAAGKRETVIEIYNSAGQVAIVSDENAAREGGVFFWSSSENRFFSFFIEIRNLSGDCP